MLWPCKRSHKTVTPVAQPQGSVAATGERHCSATVAVAQTLKLKSSPYGCFDTDHCVDDPLVSQTHSLASSQNTRGFYVTGRTPISTMSHTLLAFILGTAVACVALSWDCVLLQWLSHTEAFQPWRGQPLLGHSGCWTSSRQHLRIRTLSGDGTVLSPLS